MKQLSFNECTFLLKKYGIRLLNSIRIKSRQHLIEISRTLPYPVVIKAYTDKILHKAGSGFIKSDILNNDSLVTAYDTIFTSLKKIKTKNFSIIVQKKIIGNEFIIGSKHDITFGYVVLFGLGGIYTESLKKSAIRITPIKISDAKEMVSDISKHIPIYKSSYNRIAQTIIKVAILMQKEGIKELDLNPLIINKEGINIVDVRILR